MDKTQDSKTEDLQQEVDRGHGRDWERSEWFRRWLELIRGGNTQGAAS